MIDGNLPGALPIGNGTHQPKLDRKFVERGGKAPTIGKSGEFGVWDATWGFEGRSTFVLDKKGVVRFVESNALALDPSRTLAAVTKVARAR